MLRAVVRASVCLLYKVLPGERDNGLLIQIK